MKEDYRTGRMLARVTSAVGWIVIGIAALALAASLIAVFSGPFGFRGMGGMGGPSPGAVLLGMLAGTFSLAISGVVLVAMGQAARAVMDNANYTRQLLEHIRSG